jgi:MoxR-like ATPase
MEERPQCSLPRVQVSRQLAPARIDGPEEYEALTCEELEERLAPGGSSCGCSKRTAGWGC